MKRLMIIAVAAALAGCATPPPGPGYYGAHAAPADPSQWRVVSVTPVPLGTGDRIAATSGTGSRVEYTSRPVTVTQPVYVPTPVYIPQPVYAPAPSYWYPPVTLSLGFVFGRHWSHGRGHVGGHYRHR